MKMRRVVFSFFLFATAAAFVETVSAAPAYKLLTKATYGDADGVPLVLDVVVPTGKANGLGIIDVASGAGHAKLNDIGQTSIAEILCGQGFTLFYVRPGPSSKYGLMDMADHLQRAIVFVKRHADEYKVDQDSLGIFSTAPGVHLLTLVCMTATPETAVKAAGVYFPPTNFQKADRDLYIQDNDSAWEDVRKQAFSGVVIPDSGAIVSTSEALDPRIKLPQVSPQTPRFLIVYGDTDPLVPRGRSSLLFAALRKAGLASDRVVKRPGTDAKPTVEAEVRTLADWFAKQLGSD